MLRLKYIFPLLVVIPIFLMNVGIDIGILYYVLIILTAVWCIFSKHSSYTASVFVLFLIVNLLSIILNYNQILPIFSPFARFAAFIILFMAITPITDSKRISFLRLNILHWSCFFFLILSICNFIFYETGHITEVYQRTGVFGGISGATNMLGVIGGISFLFVCTLLVSFWKKFKFLFLGIVIIGAILSFAVLLLSASRTSLLSVLAALSVILIRIYTKKKAKLLVVLFSLSCYFLFSPLMDTYGKGILWKQRGDMQSLNYVSRESLWKQRADEFCSSPVLGIGFANTNYPTKYSLKTGRIESGTGYGSILAQTGILGFVCFCFIIIPNMLFLWRSRQSYLTVLLLALSLFFLINSVGEGYITTVGSSLCFYFWLIQGLIYSYKRGLIKPAYLLDFAPLKFLLKHG